SFVYIVSASAYFVHMIGCMFGNEIVNAILFAAINFAAFKLCYHISLKAAIFQTVLLTVLMSLSECGVVVLTALNINLSNFNNMTGIQSLIPTIFSKTIYLAEIMFVTHIFKI